MPDNGHNNGIGAAWVFTRSGGVWTQQGSKLVGTGSVGSFAIMQGAATSVALSADGNTAAVGGFGDNNGLGAAWVFTRSGGVWSQQGAKLVGTGAVGQFVQQGESVALSSDGNTAVVGGPIDNEDIGAAWVFTRSGGVWTQQGSKLVGSGAVGSNIEQGMSVAVSADGNTAVVGGAGDDGGAGAAWVYTRSGGVWSQQGAKLVGAGAVGNAWQGGSVAVAADGNTAIVGGSGDNNGIGAAWVFVQPALTVVDLAATHDFNGDSKSDILWRDTGGNVGVWLMNGATITSAVVSGSAPSNWNIVGQRDFNGDRRSDILWTDTSGNVAVWLMNGTTLSSVAMVATGVPSVWSVVGTGDFNGDGFADILWRDTGGNLGIWFMNGSTVASIAQLGNVPNVWTIQNVNVD